MKSFYVINYDFNRKKFEPYDIIPYLVDKYDELVKQNNEGDFYYKVPKTKTEFSEFIKRESMYMWWSRCEYEILLADFPNKSVIEKWDIYQQVMMNIDVITELIMNEVNNE